MERLHQAPRAGDVRHSLASIASARDHLGYTPSVDLEEGLGRTIAHYRDRLATDHIDRQRIRAEVPLQRIA